MAIKNLNPYLFFNGTADKALELYERALGAKTESIQRYGDVPAIATTCAPEDKKRVIHALVRIGGARVMLGDSPIDKPSATGSNVHVTLDFDDPQDMAQKFEALAATGKVIAGLHDAFWGAKFGALVDEFGIHWMFNCATPTK